MGNSAEHQACISGCKAPVPVELDSKGLCVFHFTQTVEQSCAEMHRQIVMRGATAERKKEVAGYLGENAILLARVTSELRLSDEMKRRILSTFLSLMNLRENLERAADRCVPEPRASQNQNLGGSQPWCLVRSA
jgi:hypothetical protein